MLFVVEGLPYADLAAATGVAENTLQVRVHRAKALLRQQPGAAVDTWWSARSRPALAPLASSVGASVK